MPTLLRIDSSPLGSSASFTRRLTDEFVAIWRRNHPAGEVLTRDLVTTDIPSVDAAWIGASFTPEENLTLPQKEVLAISNELIAELQAADEYVAGVPMHNFSIPSKLKLWVDQVVRPGKTFSYGKEGAKGLLEHKKATILVASGGVYEPGSPAAGMNFLEPYLRSIFAFMGVQDINFVNAAGTARARSEADRGLILQTALASMQMQLPGL